MRKGISSLCGVVHEQMRSDVKNGDVFIFIGRSRRLMKLFHAEDGGMVMYVKRKAAAEYALTQIQHLYKIEHMCDDAKLSLEERKAKRQQLARPIMEAMKQWMETEGVKYSESSEIGKAITYAYTRWDNMMHYLDDGRLLLDKGGIRDVDNIVEGTTSPRTRSVPSRSAGRTISSAETMRLRETWLSSAHCWQRARHTM